MPVGFETREASSGAGDTDPSALSEGQLDASAPEGQARSEFYAKREVKEEAKEGEKQEAEQKQ